MYYPVCGMVHIEESVLVMETHPVPDSGAGDGTCARDRRAPQPLALNVHVKYSADFVALD